MAEQPLHSIRFKRGDVEYELTSTAEEVARVRERVEELAMAAFEAAEGKAAASSGATERAALAVSDRPVLFVREQVARHMERLMAAPMDRFTSLPDEAEAWVASYAALAWARDELGIDGLTRAEIHKLMSERLLLDFSAPAYVWRLNSAGVRKGEVEIHGTPRLYRLLPAGEAALAAELAGLEDAAE